MSRPPACFDLTPDELVYASLCELSEAAGAQISMERRSRGEWIVRGPERRQPRDW